MLPENENESRRRFVLNWRIGAFFIVFFPLFIYLAIWQFQRGEEKEVLIQAMADRSNGPALSIYDLPINEMITRADSFRGMPLKAEGRFEKDQFVLLDNRVLKGKVGFEVLHLFVATNEATWMLVNRGFVPMGKTRSDEVPVPPLVDHNSLKGHIYMPSEESYVLDNATEKIAGRLVIQAVDFDQLGELLDRPLYPFVLRLDEADKNALPRHWPVTVMKPGMHYGYTLQWSLMAVAILALFLWTSFPVARQDGSRQGTDNKGDCRREEENNSE